MTGRRPPSFVFACGGSGGHIFPAVAVAEELESLAPGASVTFVSSGREIENEIFRTVPGRTVRVLDGAAPGGRRGGPAFLLRLLRDVKAASSFLKAERPDAVAGFGGRGSFAVVMAARMAGIPTLIHEQNVVPGVANRLLAPWSDGVALSFEETRLAGRRRRVTGNPIRRAVERECRREALACFGFSGAKKTVLVLGGSQGAESVNALFLEAASRLAPGVKNAVQVLHLCGRMDPAESERRLASMGIAAKAFSFFARMDLAYGAAELAVGRAGATFLAEMEARRLPSILIPYPHAGGHQSKNAEIVARRTGAVVAEQKNLTGEKLAELITEQLATLEGGGKREDGGVSSPPSSFLHPPSFSNARSRLADFILEIAGRR